MTGLAPPPASTSPRTRKSEPEDRLRPRLAQRLTALVSDLRAVDADALEVLQPRQLQQAGVADLRVRQVQPLQLLHPPDRLHALVGHLQGVEVQLLEVLCVRATDWLRCHFLDPRTDL